MNHLGLRILSPSNYSYSSHKDHIHVDICFVHGLNGDAFQTWTSELPGKCFWPQDLLPSCFPSARIMTFGYNANLLKDTCEGRIAEFAESLLGELAGERGEAGVTSLLSGLYLSIQRASLMILREKLRPLIFVCHSMGGIVVKRALSVAYSRPYYKSISKATHSIIFMATPHRGSLKAYWVDIGQRFISFLPGTATTSAMKELKAFSAVLEDINTDFINIANNYTYVSFFERQGTFGQGLIVEKWSAIMEHGNEVSRFPVTSNHQNICKFANEDESTFQTFVKQLRLLVKAASESADIGDIAPSMPVSRGLLEGPASDISRGFAQLFSQKRWLSDEGQTTDWGTVINPSNKKNLSSESSLPLSKAHRDISTMLFGVPHFVTARYFDRDLELSRVRLGLRNPEKPWSFGIYGLGGVGKTQLVLKYISQFQHTYSHVFWIVADSDMKLSTAYRKITLRLCLVQKDDEDPIKCRDIFKDWLLHHNRWLLVFDNVDDPYILKEYLPLSFTGAVLTTSRTSSIVENGIVEDGLQLEPLSIDEGTQFLLKKLPKIESSDESLAAEISKELGGHLLALSTMAAYITESRCPLADFLRSYRENRNELIQGTEDLRVAAFDYELSFATCWKFSIANLNGGHQAELLGILALLDPELDENIVKEFADHQESRLIPVLKSVFTYREAFRKLRRHALIQQAPESKIISIHRLVQDATIRTMEVDGTLGTAFDNTILCLSQVYPRQINGESMSKDFLTCQWLTQHVLTLEKNYQEHINIKDAKSNTTLNMKENLVEILANCGWYLYETGEITAAMTLFSTAEGICDALFHDIPHPLIALIYNNICVVYNAQNRPIESLEYAMKALRIREQCLPKNDPEMGNSYSNYAHNLFDLDKFEEAQVFYEKALALHEANDVPSDDLLEGAYCAMASNLMQLGRLDESEVAFGNAFKHHPGLGSGNFFVALTHFLYGSLKMMQEKWDEAEKHIRNCLVLRLSILGSHHRLVGVTQHHLAFLCARHGATSEAASLLRSAISVFQVPAQTQSGLLPRSMFKLSSVLSSDAEQKKNLKAMREALVLQEKAKEICQNDSKLAGLPTTNDKEWEKLVYISYRCC